MPNSGSPISRSAALFAAEQGSVGPTLVLLHGFGSNHRYWKPVIGQLDVGRRIIVHDLPGHGQSPPLAQSSRTADMAEALIGDLANRVISPVHLAGHSMGGAVVCLVALKKPSLVASLTLLAPGGFGPKINADLLRRYALARDVETLKPLLDQFYGSGHSAPQAALANVLEDRRRSGNCEALSEIAEEFLKGDNQGVLPLEAIAALDIPITVICGEEDRVVPVEQARALSQTHPESFDVHIYKGVGHSIADEIPEEVARLILRNAR